MNPWRQLGAVLAETGREWRRDGVPRLAAALAYYTLFSLAPLLVVAIGIAGYFFGAEAARGEIVAQFSAFLGRTGASAVEALLASTGSEARNLIAALLGAATLLVGASGVFRELQDAMNVIWNVEPRPHAGWKTFLRRRFLSFAMVLGTGFLLLVSLLTSAALAATGRWLATSAPTVEVLWSTLNALLGFAVPVVLFAFVFRLVPDAKVRWRDAWTGALATAALFALGRSAIAFYLGRGALDTTFGAAASLVAVVFWVYYSAQILFLGAELTQVIGRDASGRSRPPKPGAERVERAVRGASARPRRTSRG